MSSALERWWKGEPAMSGRTLGQRPWIGRRALRPERSLSRPAVRFNSRALPGRRFLACFAIVSRLQNETRDSARERWRESDPSAIGVAFSCRRFDPGYISSRSFGRRRPQGQPDDELAAPARAVAQGQDAAAVQRDEAADQRQADPKAAAGAIP